MFTLHSLTRFIFLTCLCWLLALGAACAQYCYTKVYDKKNGLPDVGAILTMYQDTKGILWIGTHLNGLVRFDGKSYISYNTKTGANADQILYITEDRYGNIWAQSIEHGTFYVTPQGKITNVEYVHKGTAQLRNIYTTPHQPGVMGFSFENGIPRYSQYDYKNHNFTPLPMAYDTLSDTLQYRKDDLNIYTSFGTFTRLTNKYTQETDIYIGSPQGYKKTRLSNHFINNVIAGWGEYKNGILIETSTAFLYCDEQHCKLIFDKKTLPAHYGKQLHSFSKSGDYFSSIFQSDTPNEYNIVCLHLPTGDMQVYHFYAKSITNNLLQVLRDKAGNFWVNNNNKLIKVFPHITQINYDEKNMVDGLYQIVEDKTGKIWLGGYRDGAAYLQNGKLYAQPEALKKLGVHYISGNLKDEKGNLWLLSENGGSVKFDDNNKFVIYNFKNSSDNVPIESKYVGYYLYKSKKGSIYMGSADNGLAILNKEKSFKNGKVYWRFVGEEKGITTGNVLTITEDNYERIWYGRTSKGIGVYDPATDTAVTFERKNVAIERGAMSSVTDAKGNIWWGTDNGLYVFTPPATMPTASYNFNTHLKPVAHEALGNSTIGALRIWKDRYLMIGNEKGVSLLDLHTYYATGGKQVICMRLQDYGIDITGTGQNNMLIDSKNNFWASCDDGVLKLDAEFINADTLLPNLYIDSLKVGNIIHKGEALQHCVELARFERSVKIFFHVAPNPLLHDNVRFRYRLSTDTVWSDLLDISHVAYENLAPGNYTFQLKAIKNGIESDAQVLAFHIATPLEQRWWFVLAVVGTIFLFGAYLTHKDMQVKTRDIEIEKSKFMLEQINKEKTKLTVQAIVNQLNPHFINNALQWLQIRVFNDAEAVSVVGKLSENISTVFRNSRNKKAYHTLAEELKLTANYLYIQKMRFGKRIDYEVTPSTDISALADKNVPLMIIQIHVENAVEHGLRNKQGGSGYVKILVKDIDANYFQIQVEDNGVGREAAQKIGSLGTQQGTKMLRELEAIYNAQNEYPLRQTYDDGIFCDDTAPQPYGTRVNIMIPKIFNFTID